MIRCSLPTSLQSRALLCRPPWIHSRLPHLPRSFASASRLAKNHDVEPAEGPAQESPPKQKETDGSESKKSGRTKAAESESTQESAPKQKERNDNESHKSTKKKAVSPGDHDKGEAKTKGARSKRKTIDAKSIVPKALDGIKGRRARVRKFILTSKDSEKVVERKIARMRVQIEAIEQKNRERDATEKRDATGKSLGDTVKGRSLKDALLGAKAGEPRPKKSKATIPPGEFEKLDIKYLNPEELDFAPIEYDIPPVPKLSYGLDRVLFNPGVYRLQDPRSRVYNFDPYLEKIMSVDEFNFAALSEYKTSSKDEELLALTERVGTKFTGSTSSMSGALQHFHFLLSNFRKLNHKMLSKEFPDPTERFSKITEGPSAIFLRWKDGIYAIDADKAYDTPNIMSWLGHSLEKLLTSDRNEFERYRRSTGSAAPGEDESSRCYHYSKLGNFLMRSQLDAYDPRLPGTGIFDLKTRAVVSIRMNHEEYETGKGYQIRYDHGEWESYEREYYDMTRATMLKYSLQVRMGRMDGIFVAYHNIDRIFGFQYLPLTDMDNVLHGQKDTCLGDQEFKMSISLLDELMQKATETFPEQTLRLHFHTHRSSRGNPPFMYIFAEPVTEEQADAIQNKNQEAFRAFERDVVGIKKDDPTLQAEWHEIQERVDEELEEVDNKEVDKVGDAQAAEEPAELATEGELEDASESPPGDGKDSEPETPTGPLMGWTLAVRHRLNGAYVERPENLKPDDSWTVEYHIRELNEGDRWALYEKVKKKRNELIGEQRDSAGAKASMEKYREVIKKYSNRGRVWREEQDALAAQREPEVFQPLGPGSEPQSS